MPLFEVVYTVPDDPQGDVTAKVISAILAVPDVASAALAVVPIGYIQKERP
jgi:hypothetical protein